MKESKRQFTAMEKFGLPIALVLVVFGLYLRFGYDPMAKENIDLKVSISNVSNKIWELEGSNQKGRKESADQDFRRAETRFRSARKDFGEMRGIIASGAEERSLMLDRIGKIAEDKYKLKMRNFEESTAAPREKAGLEQKILGEMTHYRTVIIGDFFSLNDFFKDIARVEGKLVLIDKVELTKSLTGDEKCRATVEFSL